MNRLRHPRTLIVVLLLPVLVAAVGMWALSGRVDRIDEVPAAVVNLDEGTTMEVDGEEQMVPFGRLLAGALTQPGTVEGQEAPEMTGFDWRLTDVEDARQGLRDGTYAAVVTIPADFSDKVGTLGTPDAVQAQLQVTTNDASGQLNALVGTAVAQASASTMGGEMARQYLDGIYLGFNDLQSSFDEAAAGARELADGTSELDDGLGQTADGTEELADGADEAAGGTRELADGAWGLADGTRAAADGNRQLADGLGGLADGTDGVAGGSRDLATGLDELAGGVEGAASGTDELATGLDELADGTEELADGATALETGLTGTDTEPGLLDGADALRSGVEGDGTPENPGLVAGADQLATGLEGYADGVQSAYDGLSAGLSGNDQQAGLVTGSEQVADGSRGVADGLDELKGGLAGDGTVENPGMVALATSLRDQACAAVEADPADVQAQALCQQAEGNLLYAQSVDGALNGDGTDQNPGLVSAADQVAGGAEQVATGVDAFAGPVQGAIDTAFNGDGTVENPGLIAPAQALATGARTSADAAPVLVDGVGQLADGLHAYADGVGEFSDGASELATGARDAADGAGELSGGLAQLSDGTRASADGADDLADGAGQLADGARSSADGAGELADGAGQLADGTRELAEGSDELAGGIGELASGTEELADGTRQLADGSTELADGTDELATGLREGADSVPTYSESERERMAEMGAEPITSVAERQNEAAGASTATFPFVAALALWMGAFATFLLLPALSGRLLDRALPMWQVALRSLAPAVGIAVVQAVAVLAVITAVGVSPVSPISVGVVAVAGAIMFAVLHQALMALCGDRIGRIVSVLLLVLQAVALVGIVPVQTAPPLLQSVSDLMPLTIVSQGLVHAALGGQVTSLGSVLGSILAWALIGVVVTLVATRNARSSRRTGHAAVGMVPAAA
ncbi:YhgE/Pip domain-containing protein [Brachybacterium muris]|uniref:YhgE/Pip domain-containing protein n=1 Tax=Brachybacterium muris TaxID=219301 RepID=UPI00223B014D|nr:YhgE/Pip domain-containing protein [Brachybacterium muris]MCT2294564.1 YhgE/Pip domain-containing protein [Brachybacterium muris]